jgi:hypothetical protein
MVTTVTAITQHHHLLTVYVIANLTGLVLGVVIKHNGIKLTISDIHGTRRNILTVLCAGTPVLPFQYKHTTDPNFPYSQYLRPRSGVECVGRLVVLDIDIITHLKPGTLGQPASLPSLSIMLLVSELSYGQVVACHNA